MYINKVTFYYDQTKASKLEALFEVQKFFESRRCGGYLTYVPVIADTEIIPASIEQMLDYPVLVLVKEYTEDMQEAFQIAYHPRETMNANRIRSLFNGVVSDYASSLVKELLLDEDYDVVKKAVQIATEYRLCAMSLMPYSYSHVRNMNLNEDAELKACGKVLAMAIC